MKHAVSLGRLATEGSNGVRHTFRFVSAPLLLTIESSNPVGLKNRVGLKVTAR